MSQVALQAAIDAIERSRGSTDPLIVAKVRALMFGYAHRWAGDDYVTISAEEAYHLPVINPATGAASRTFTQGGKFDGVIERDGKVYLLEHKSSSEDIIDPDAVYWRRLEIDSQVSHYVMANWMMERKVDGTLYDVIGKPGIKPRALTIAERKQIAEEGVYFGFKVSDAELERVKEASEKIDSFKEIKKQTNADNKKREKAGEPIQEIPQYVLDGADADVRESIELYEARLARDCIENGNKYYQRKVITRLDQDIAEYAGELWDVAQSMLHARNNEANYRNSGACMTYGSPCEYLGVCSGYDSIDSPNWERSESVHSELPIVADNGGRDLLTNSRLKCFQTCRRKHFYRYELGVRRVGGEDKEALVFGSLLHTGLENFWICFMKDESNASSIGVAAGNEAVGVASSQQELFGGDSA